MIDLDITDALSTATDFNSFKIAVLTAALALLEAQHIDAAVALMERGDQQNANVAAMQLAQNERTARIKAYQDQLSSLTKES